MNRYIDFTLVDKYPNKYNLTPDNIKSIKVLDWDKLKKYTWENKAIKEHPLCHIEGSGTGKHYDDEDEFWIGFFSNGKTDCKFTAHEGMCKYIFDEFYQSDSIENRYDMVVQANAIRYLNMLIDNNIVSKPNYA